MKGTRGILTATLLNWIQIKMAFCIFFTFYTSVGFPKKEPNVQDDRNTSYTRTFRLVIA